MHYVYLLVRSNKYNWYYRIFEFMRPASIYSQNLIMSTDGSLEQINGNILCIMK